MKPSTTTLISTAVLSLVSLAAHAADKPAAAPAKFQCDGGNACKGQSLCHTKSGNSCAGTNACKGQGWINTKDQAECDKIKAGMNAAPKADPKPKVETKKK